MSKSVLRFSWAESRGRSQGETPPQAVDPHPQGQGEDLRPQALVEKEPTEARLRRLMEMPPGRLSPARCSGRVHEADPEYAG